eukprot:8081102-Prorocentrum_lima.AAC.1
MTSSLVGSEMCIRDSLVPEHTEASPNRRECLVCLTPVKQQHDVMCVHCCLLYTSDAADDM